MDESNKIQLAHQAISQLIEIAARNTGRITRQSIARVCNESQIESEFLMFRFREERGVNIYDFKIEQVSGCKKSDLEFKLDLARGRIDEHLTRSTVKRHQIDFLTVKKRYKIKDDVVLYLGSFEAYDGDFVHEFFSARRNNFIIYEYYQLYNIGISD